ncbi:MAG: glycosyltransferase family 2 protein [Fimbriimonadaceae bacterium]
MPDLGPLSLILLVVYGVLVLVPLANLFLMRRPRGRGSASSMIILIPARNEAENLRQLVPALVGQGATVLVFNDESEDDTQQVAAAAGATVLSAAEPLPEGWTGKNRACHMLALAAAETSPAEWIVFLDADAVPEPDFVSRLAGLLESISPAVRVVSGMPRLLSGKGPEPIYLSWVPWMILATIPFGLISRSRLGHPRFLNGQMVCWRARTYAEIWPHRELSGAVLEDVGIGRLLARRGIRVEIADLAPILSVRMYADFRQALDGMSKNAVFIAGSSAATIVVALMCAALAWGWLLMGASLLWGLGMLWLSKRITDRLCRIPIWVWPFAPLTLTLAGFTFLRSLVWRAKGQIRWKGRVYR